MRQLRNKWLVVLPILAISTMAFGQVFHPAVGAGTYGNPYGWLGNSGANAWEQYRMGTGTTTTLLPTDLPIQATNVVGNNTRVDYSWLVQSYPAGWGGGSAELNAIDPNYKPSVNEIGGLVGMTSATTDPANLLYLTGTSDSYEQRWTAGQLDITVAFMENPAAWLTKVGGDTGNVDPFGSPDANGRGTDMVIMRWETKLSQTASSSGGDNLVVVNSSRSVDIPGSNTSNTMSANLTEHHAATGGHTGTTAKRYFTGTDANVYGGNGNNWSLGIAASDYVYDPSYDDANQTDVAWIAPATYQSPNAEENPYSSDAPIELSFKLYQTTGSVAMGGTDKFAPNTGDGNDWSNNDVIFQTKFGATAFSRKIDIQNPNNPDAIDWDGGTFDWANAKPVVMINGQWSWMPTRVEMGVLAAGDVNSDGQVTMADFGILANPVNFAQPDKAWQHGDLNQDGTVTMADFGILANPANFAQPITAGGVPGPGEIEIVVDYTTGVVTIVANNCTVVGLEILSAASGLVPANWNSLLDQGVASAWTELGSVAWNLTESGFTSYLLDGSYNIGAIYDTTADPRDLLFSYLDSVTWTPVYEDVTYVPEPATLSLLVLGGIGVLLRRRR